MGSAWGRKKPSVGAVYVLRVWIKSTGCRAALYTDWKNVYKRKATPGEQLRGEVPVTEFERRCQKPAFGLSRPVRRRPRHAWNAITAPSKPAIKKLRRETFQRPSDKPDLKKEYLPQHRRSERPPASPKIIDGTQAEHAGTCEHLPPGDHAQHQQRLGDPKRCSLAAAADPRRTLWTKEVEQGLVSEYDGRTSGRSTTGTSASGPVNCRSRCAPGRVDAAAGKSRVAEKSQTRPSLAFGLSEQAGTSWDSAAVWPRRLFSLFRFPQCSYGPRARTDGMTFTKKGHSK